MKLLSITIPCYNSQDYMEKCIESLLVGGGSLWRGRKLAGCDKQLHH